MYRLCSFRGKRIVVVFCNIRLRRSFQARFGKDLNYGDCAWRAGGDFSGRGQRTADCRHGIRCPNIRVAARRSGGVFGAERRPCMCRRYHRFRPSEAFSMRRAAAPLLILPLLSTGQSKRLAHGGLSTPMTTRSAKPIFNTEHHVLSIFKTKIASLGF